MRFQFCGDLDCPDWVLAGINLLSRMSSLKLRTLCTMTMKSLLGEELDMVIIQKATSDAKLDDAELRAAVSVLSFVLESAVRHRVAAAQLGQELQQLGLPREHAASLGRVLDQHSAELMALLRQRSLKHPGLAELHWELVLGADSAAEPAGCAALIGLELRPDDGRTAPVRLLLTPQTAAVCRRELLIARQRMEDVS